MLAASKQWRVLMVTMPDRSAFRSYRAFALGVLGLLAACRDTPPDIGGKPDSGNTMTMTCSRREDCGGSGICVAGICERVVPCTPGNDSQCTASGKVCHQTRGYCVACDGREGQCGAGLTCQFDFTCVPLGGNDAGVADGGSCGGSCTDRTMCGNDQVCRGNMCCAPPARCSSADQCPQSRPLCNGATGECFGGDSCTTDGQCDTKPGCSPGTCFCDAPGAGQPGECKPRPNACNNDQECFQNGQYVGKYCTIASTPHQCNDAPNCTRDQDCSAAGLVCDLGAGNPSMGRCINGMACPTGNECPQTQTCQAQVCVAKNCINTPNFCNAATETCNAATGQCVPTASGSCQTDGECPAGNYCDTAVNRCALGCRVANDCGGAVCNAAHRCEQGMGTLCGPCMTDADCPARTKCMTNAFTMAKVCYETCTFGGSCTLNPNSTCLINKCLCIGGP